MPIWEKISLRNREAIREAITAVSAQKLPQTTAPNFLSCVYLFFLPVSFLLSFFAMNVIVNGVIAAAGSCSSRGCGGGGGGGGSSSTAKAGNWGHTQGTEKLA